MSSTVSSTEVLTLPKKMVLKMEDKPQRLVRTSSLDKIRRFNSYICSQQYYFLPTLLSLVKSSQLTLHSSTEKSIFRSAIFTAVFYKALLRQIQSTYRRTEPTLLLKVVVYLIGLVLLSELSLCVYLLGNTSIPGGLIFLLVCWLYINYLHLRASLFYVENHIEFKKAK